MLGDLNQPDLNKRDNYIILVVEDNHTQAEYLRSILERESFSVILVNDGESAVNYLKQSTVDIVLTDIVMPGMDGYTLCNWIKNPENGQSCPVILVTQLFDPVDVVKGLVCNADNFIIKPFNAKEVVNRISMTIAHDSNLTVDSDGKNIYAKISGDDYLITADKKQILNILLSTYETAIVRNAELERLQEDNYWTNEQLKIAISNLKKSNNELEHEISEKKSVSLALAGANKKLQLMSSITRHDLLNQLTSIQGYIDLVLLEKEQPSEKIWYYLEKTISVINNTVEIVKFTGEYQEIGIKNSVWQNLYTIVQNAINRNTSDSIITENFIPKNIEVFADPLIEMVFFNLIHNAKSYGKKIKKIQFRFSIENGIGSIICEDDGVGVALDKKQKIFDYRYGNHTGLGLFLSKEILLITDLTIEESGIPDVGAKFIITCPKKSIRIVD